MEKDGENLIDRVTEGRSFAEFRESDSYKVVIGELADEIFKRWRSTDKPEVAKELWHRMRGVETFKQWVDQKIANGVTAVRELEQRRLTDEQGHGASPLVRGTAKRAGR